ncbi:MAG: OB-fold domain-containing protein [Candidatus Tectomicrobia bacterium]|uniref:OB-fold domain-containing protein n=1 Tax=Tectimicrobiota bacterium TaxID=2528274 RepID=A0A932CMV9_UNCTE|nr:OB-fold domain-containing protein [Candidatus Tectomicrobia bacterium]
MSKTRLELNEVSIREGIFELPPSPNEIPRLLGSRCRACGEVVFPELEICPKCDTEERMEKVTLSHRGRLYSYSIVMQSTPEFKPPYAVGIVELVPEGILILSHIVGNLGEEFEKLEMGIDLELTLAPICVNAQGQRVVSYAFTPVK